MVRVVADRVTCPDGEAIGRADSGRVELERVPLDDHLVGSGVHNEIAVRGGRKARRSRARGPLRTWITLGTLVALRAFVALRALRAIDAIDAIDAINARVPLQTGRASIALGSLVALQAFGANGAPRADGASRTSGASRTGGTRGTDGAPGTNDAPGNGRFACIT